MSIKKHIQRHEKRLAEIILPAASFVTIWLLTERGIPIEFCMEI